MAFANVDLTNSLEFFRVVTNQLILAMNYYTGNAFTLTGNVYINPNSIGSVTLNVNSGIIQGNGSLLFGIPSNGFSGSFGTTQLQNNSVTITTSNGITGGGTVSLGANLYLNIATVDSIVNTRTNLPLSANAITALTAQTASIYSNASLRTTGIVQQSQGGTGFTNYASGQLLIGNGVSGLLEKNTVAAGAGITINSLPGSFTLGANLIAGQNVIISGFPTGNGMNITQAEQVYASDSVLGITTLLDGLSFQSITTAATAASLNSMAAQIVTLSADAAQGRLVRVDVYRTPGSYVWTKPTEANIEYIQVDIVGAGGRAGSIDANAPVGILAAANLMPARVSGGGGAGAYIKSRIFSPNTTYNITIGAGAPWLLYQNSAVDGIDGEISFIANGTANVLMANGGRGGANSRAFNSNNGIGIFGRLYPATMGHIDGANPRGMGGGVNYLIDANVIIDIAVPGGNAGPVIGLMGGNFWGGSASGNLKPAIVQSRGGDCFFGGNPDVQYAQPKLTSGAAVINFHAQHAFGWGGTGLVDTSSVFARGCNVSQAGNGMCIVYSYSKI